MNLTFPEQKLRDIIQAVDTVIDTTPPPHFAAFDADGTLWATDLGEALFAYQIQHNLVPLPKDPWQHYENLKLFESHEKAYLWLAQLNKGVPLATVRAWALQSVSKMHPVPVFPSQKKLIAHLTNRGVCVFIVTASIKWAVEPGARFFDLSYDQVIGIQTAIDTAGCVTTEQKGPITWRQGKVEGLLQASGGVRPIFCAGNTEGDLALLESSSHLRLVMAASPSNNENYKTERQLLKIAHERGWYAHDFTV